MEGLGLEIKDLRQNGYKSQYVEDRLGGETLKTTAIVVVNIYEDIRQIQIKIAASGFTRENFQIEFRRGNLFLYAEKAAGFKKKYLLYTIS